MDVITPMGALELALAMRRGELSSERVTAAFLDRIALRNPQLGALVSTWPARARRRARAFDRQRAAGRAPAGIFAGVPSAIKDTDASRGSRLRMGSRACHGLLTPFDGAVARRVRAGGFNLIGKSATSEFALMPVTETDIHPPCRNPADPAFSAGGSSGGAAAAVADRLLPVAHGSDAAGSIRIPASFCGLFGLKPSRGLLPNFYPWLDRGGLCVVNCLARSVEDSAAFLDALRGHGYAPDAPGPTTLLAAARKAPPRLRIRYCQSSPAAETHPAVAAAVEETAARLRALGHALEAMAPLALAVDDFLPVWQHLSATIPLPPGARVQACTAALRGAGARLAAAHARQLQQRLAHRVLGWLGAADLWLTPTVGPLPPRVGAHLHGRECDGDAQVRAVAPLAAFTAPFNVTGQPAASLPLARFDSGLPIGIQLAARPGADGLLLSVCRQLQQQQPFEVGAGGC
ncbi:MAG: amidase [Myxococcales bacterium]|nr:amidase [Myxococcales bacterium]